ncbi:hypothetical protein MGH68_15685 [Erysipelothrix sp. D19-032]
MNEYKASSIVLGEVVHVNNDPISLILFADIDEHGYLIVEDVELNRHVLNAAKSALEEVSKMKTKDLTLAALFAGFIAISSYIVIPLPVVPFSLQVFRC